MKHFSADLYFVEVNRKEFFTMMVCRGEFLITHINLKDNGLSCQVPPMSVKKKEAIFGMGSPKLMTEA